jgi:hypothetical protein
MLVGLTVMSRLTFAPLALIHVAEIYHREKSFRRVFTFVGGCLAGFLPAIVLFALSPEHFIFNNFGYHVERTGMTEDELAIQRWKILGALLGIRPAAGINNYQFAILFYAATFSATARLIRSRFIDFNYLAALLLLLVHAIPSPTYLQYFSVTVPFLIPPALVTAQWFYLVIKSGNSIRNCAATASAVCILILYSSAIRTDVVRYTVTGHGVIGVGKRMPKAWKIQTIKKVSEVLDSRIQPDEVVFASWPGYLLESRARALARTENPFGMIYAERSELPLDRQLNLKVRDPDDVLAAMKEGEVRTAVVFAPVHRTNKFKDALVRTGLEELAQIRGAVILHKAPTSPR